MTKPARTLLDLYTSMPYKATMYTIIETPIFSADAKATCSEDERGEFCAWLAENPHAGDVVPGSGGCRKYAGRGRAWASVAGCG